MKFLSHHVQIVLEMFYCLCIIHLMGCSRRLKRHSVISKVVCGLHQNQGFGSPTTNMACWVDNSHDDSGRGKLPNNACTRLVGVAAFSGSLRGLKLIPA